MLYKMSDFGYLTKYNTPDKSNTFFSKQLFRIAQQQDQYILILTLVCVRYIRLYQIEKQGVLNAEKITTDSCNRGLFCLWLNPCQCGNTDHGS
ncbi:protein of unknown function [Maridesulfovibrio hydrothermalis AM13 = DSM 14728]|uniref:Uncharacterized protein n=1 Tax=Maridesulfovibrio hydrothermalis AM13 = DSM 14728 TaxID=1121451 RepID=L0RA93_9BACT|nr:protein of unknown function [Maridesulfovibrio hydrothermalis AM13 = DSM 14728]